MRLWFVWWLVAGCGTPPIDCASVAITDTQGNADPCDQQACQACVDSCGMRCEILESYPPHYACQGGSSWSGYDECPDWDPLP